jgi:hypothetical protein
MLTPLSQVEAEPRVDAPGSYYTRFKFVFEWVPSQGKPWFDSVIGASLSSSVGEPARILTSSPRDAEAHSPKVIDESLRCQSEQIWCATCSSWSPHVFNEAISCYNESCRAFFAVGCLASNRSKQSADSAVCHSSHRANKPTLPIYTTSTPSSSPFQRRPGLTKTSLFPSSRPPSRLAPPKQPTSHGPPGAVTTVRIAVASRLAPTGGRSLAMLAPARSKLAHPSTRTLSRCKRVHLDSPQSCWTGWDSS